MENSECFRTMLQSLEGEQLSAVTFVQDYVQLHFDGPCLSSYVWPQIESHGKLVIFPDPSYRDILCEQITKIVKSTFVQEGDKLVIEFADSTILQISLKEKDRVCAEAAMLRVEYGVQVW